MKVNLQADGRDKRTTEGKKVARPSEGEWFEVDPQAIDQKLFEEKRADPDQEALRKLINEAFYEMNNNPEKYGKKFKTLMPKYTWGRATVASLQKMACELGDHNANWVEKALEWAQRIANGEKWEIICNNPDTGANWFTLLIWKNNQLRLVGGSYQLCNLGSPSKVWKHTYNPDTLIECAVPLVVAYAED